MFKSEARLFVFLFAYAVLFFLMLAHFERPVNIYQARDISFALQVLQGKFVWLGPDLLGGGKAPGPFFYWLLAVPVWLFQSWEAVNALAVVLTSAAAVLLFHLLSREVSRPAGFAAFFLFLNSYAVEKNLLSFWNPSYIVFFQVLLLWVLFSSFLSVKTRILTSLFLIALSMQIHMSQVLFLLPLALLMLQNRKTLEKKFFLQTAGVFLLPLLPYLWGTFLAKGGAGTGLSAALRTFLIPGAEFGAENVLSYLKSNAAYDPFFLGTGLLLFSGLSSPFQNRKIFAVLTVMAAVPALWAFFNPALIRYSLVFAILLAAVSAKAAAQLSARQMRLWFAFAFFSLGVQIFLRLPDWRLFFDVSVKGAVVALLFFAVSGALLFSFRNAENKNFLRGLLFVSVAGAVLKYPMWTIIDRDYRNATGYSKFGLIYSESLDETRRFTRFVQATTNWSYEEFRERTVVIGFSRETDLSQVYPSAAGGNPAFDGLIAVRKTMMSEGLVPRLLSEMKKSGELTCQVVDLTAGINQVFDFCFYRLKSPGFRLNNIGYAYLKPVISGAFSDGAHNELVKISPSHAVYQYVGCADLEKCLIAVDMKMDSRRLVLSFDGFPIAVPDVAVTPFFGATLEGLSLQVRCVNGNEIEVSAVSALERIGFSPVRSSFLAPVLITAEIPCEPQRLRLRADLTSFRTSQAEAEPDHLMIEWLPRN